MNPFGAWWQLNGFTRVRWTDAFWRKVALTSDPAGCWLWLKGRNSSGYGVLRWRGAVVLAHRLAYELVNGPIPAGMLVRHRCDHQLCCRPSHLVLGWHADNMADMKERGRGRTMVLTADRVAAILASTKTAAVLAEENGVTATAISKIRRGAVYGPSTALHFAQDGHGTTRTGMDTGKPQEQL